MPIKNSFATLSQQVLDLQKNSLEVLTSLTQVVSSQEDDVTIEVINELGQKEQTNLFSLGFLKAELERISQNVNTLASVDQRGSIIQPSQNTFKRIVVQDLNKEPNTISELEGITTFIDEKNWFFDGLLNPILKVRLNLGDRIEENVRKILSRRYIVQFDLDDQGNPTTQAQTAIDNFNETFNNRTNIGIPELESWLVNTAGVKSGKTGSKIEYDEQEFELEPNRLQFEGFFTILGSEEDIANRRLWYSIDTLDYFEIDTQQKRQLVKGDELIINKDISTTKYRVIDIDQNASETRVRFERIEGNDPIPVNIVGGMKYNSTIVNEKNVDVSIGFDEYNVVFVKAINTDNSLVSREWSQGVSFYTNDLTLFSNDGTANNGKSMQEFYINTVSDFGELLKDLVERKIPRQKGITPNAPVLNEENFRVIQINRHLTDTTDDERARRQNAQIRELRSKINETNKTILEKNRELLSKTFRNPKDKENVKNQIEELRNTASNDSELLNTIVNELLANQANRNVPNRSYKLQGFWNIPSPVENGKSRNQEVIAFRVQYRKSNLDGKENENDPFKVTNDDGTETNAVFSPWIEEYTRPRERSFDVNTQRFVWLNENLESIDAPNINSVNLDIFQNEQIEIRVKAVSEVGYPDSLLESSWSNAITIGFPDDLVEGRDPNLQFTKNAELEDVRNRVQTDLNRLGMTQHLSSSVTFEDTFFPHTDENIGVKEASGKFITLRDKLTQIQINDPVEQYKDINLITPWANYGSTFGNARYYKHEGRVYLSGLIRIDRAEQTNFRNRFPNFIIRAHGNTKQNVQYVNIAFLPEGYRPDTTKLFNIGQPTTPVSGNAVAGRLDVLANGLILAADVTSSWVNLDGISFRAIN